MYTVDSTKRDPVQSPNVFLRPLVELTYSKIVVAELFVEEHLALEFKLGRKSSQQFGQSPCFVAQKENIFSQNHEVTPLPNHIRIEWAPRRCFKKLCFFRGFGEVCVRAFVIPKN